MELTAVAFIWKRKRNDMISVVLLGGLGNQMFVYAFARALSVQTGQQILLIDEQSSDAPEAVCGLQHFRTDENAVKIVKGNFLRSGLRPISIKLLMGCAKLLDIIGMKAPKMLHFAQRAFNLFSGIAGVSCQYNGYLPVQRLNKKRNFLYRGYYQSERYFEGISSIIRDELRIKDELSRENEEFLQLIERGDSVCVHVRRGDYTSAAMRKRFLVCTVDYYQRAAKRMLLLKPQAKFFVFSDDINWTKSNIIFPSNTTFMNNNNSSYEDMLLMYSCKHFILSNSSFSWWAQYLGDAKDKIVIAPDRWYNKIEDNDIYCRDWLIEEAKSQVAS
ncbi:MAG: alpha-1,2-fucosyltransferase [Clostridia bacterium]